MILIQFLLFQFYLISLVKQKKRIVLLAIQSNSKWSHFLWISQLVALVARLSSRWQHLDEIQQELQD